MAKRDAKSKDQNAAPADFQKSILKMFDDDLAVVEKLADPGEKLLRLEQIETDIEGVIKRTNTDISSRSKKKGFAPYLSIASGSGATIIALTALSHITLAGLATVPAIIAGAYVGERQVAKEKKRLTETSAEFFAALEAQKAQAATLSENLLKTELTALARSPKFINLLAASPSLRDQWPAAFSKLVSAQKDNAVPQQIKVPTKALNL